MASSLYNVDPLLQVRPLSLFNVNRNLTAKAALTVTRQAFNKLATYLDFHENEAKQLMAELKVLWKRASLSKWSLNDYWRIKALNEDLWQTFTPMERGDARMYFDLAEDLRLKIFEIVLKAVESERVEDIPPQQAKDEPDL